MCIVKLKAYAILEFFLNFFGQDSIVFQNFMRLVEGKDILESTVILDKVIILTVNITGSVQTVQALVFNPMHCTLSDGSDLQKQ